MRKVVKSVVFMTMTLTTLFSSLIFAAEAKQAFEPDHYLSYDIKAGPYFNDRVTLKDQFLGPLDFSVDRPIKLLNPTLKRHGGQVFEIKRPKLHYTAYHVRPLQDFNIKAKVLVYNQFGQFIFEQFRPSRLLAPTRKISFSSITPNPNSVDAEYALQADHYLCYDVPPQTVTTGFGYLKDQFRSRGFETLVAARLCNPVAKRHRDKNFDVINSDATNHLLCFQLPKKQIFRMTALVDQFGTKGALALSDDELCVPSVKIKLSSDQCEGSLPDIDGQCGGACPNETDVCLQDPIKQLCRCYKEAPTECQAITPDREGQCNGICPLDQVCVADLTNDSCQCHEITRRCGLMADGQCGGACPTQEEVCVLVPGTNECDCIPR